MINRLDNEYPAYIAAQESFLTDPGANGVLEVTSPIHLLEFVDPKRLQGRFDRIAEMRYDTVFVQYLESLGMDSGFVKHLVAGDQSIMKVFAKGADVKIRVEGLKTDLLLWEVPISIQIRELYYNAVAEAENLDVNALVIEGARRFQVKGDMLRNSRVKFVEAGTRYRYSSEWHSLLLQIVTGDMGDLLLGTTNLAMALAFALTPIANEDAFKVASPTVQELEALVNSESRPIVVTGTNAFQMAHLYGHLGNQVSFEWDQDLTGDMGPAGAYLPLDFKFR